MLSSIINTSSKVQRKYSARIRALHIQFNKYNKNVAANSKKKHAVLPALTEEELRAGCRLGLDSHADMTCVGRHAHIHEIYHGKLCNVFPFNDSYEPIKDITTVNAAFAYDTDEGQTYIIELNQCLNF